MSAQCSVRITGDGWGPGYSCSRKATVERGGKPYCTQHDPEKVKARREASWQRYKEASAQREKDRITDAIALLRKEGYTVTPPGGKP